SGSHVFVAAPQDVGQKESSAVPVGIIKSVDIARLPLLDQTRLAAEVGVSDLSELLSKYFVECVQSGWAFADLHSREHISKGIRLFSFAHDLIDKVDTLIAVGSPLPETAAVLHRQLAGLDAVVADEHPQLLGTLFSLRTQILRLKSPVLDEVYLSSALFKLNQYLHSHHLLTKIFFKIRQNHTQYPPEDCMDQLATLPSTIFNNIFRDRLAIPGWISSLKPSYESPDTRSDYGSMSYAQSVVFPDHDVDLAYPEPITTPQLQAPPLAASPTKSRDHPQAKQEWESPHTSVRQDTPSSLASDVDSDDLSDSDLSEDETLLPITHADKKREIVEGILQHFLSDFDKWVAVVISRGRASKAAGGNDAAPPTQSENKTVDQPIGDSKLQSLKGKGKRTAAEDEQEESDNDGAGRGTPNKRGRLINDKGRRFACPYYKHNPRRYRHIKSCTSTAFNTVHRVKEHITRTHRQRPSCARCHREFSNGDTLKEHLRLQPSCEVSNETPIHEGFDSAQEEQLKRRGKGTQVEQWQNIYRILFDVPEKDIPTPYYDNDISIFEREETFKEYVQRELMPRVRQVVGARVEQYFSQAGPVIQAALADIVRDLDECLWRDFEAERLVERHGTTAQTLETASSTLPVISTAIPTGCTPNGAPVMCSSTSTTATSREPTEHRFSPVIAVPTRPLEPWHATAGGGEPQPSNTTTTQLNISTDEFPAASTAMTTPITMQQHVNQGDTDFSQSWITYPLYDSLSFESFLPSGSVAPYGAASGPNIGETSHISSSNQDGNAMAEFVHQPEDEGDGDWSMETSSQEREQ
ncbi:Sal-like protein 3, partial [Madurella mycetomatis]